MIAVITDRITSVREMRVPLRPPFGLMLMLKAYLDETGTDAGSAIVGIGGAVASEEDWESLETQWNAVLTQYQITRLHMREFAHFLGEFAKWSPTGVSEDEAYRREQERRQFFSSLVRLTCSKISGTFGGAIAKGAFDALTPEQKAYVLDPYWPCLQVFFDGAAHRAKQLNEKVHVYVAHHPEFTVSVAKNYDMIKRQLDGLRVDGGVDPVSGYLDSFTIQEGQPAPLQVADLIAYEMNKEIRRQIAGKPAEPRWAMREFQRGLGRIEIVSSLADMLLRLPRSVGGTGGE